MPRIKIAEQVGITKEQLEIFIKCAKSPFEFSKYIHVIHPTRGKVPFALYPFQEATLKKFLDEPFNVILKFRQAGLTELISMFCLWYAQFHPYKNIVIISIKDRVAKKVLRKIKFMYKNLPDFLKVPVINGKNFKDVGTLSEMEFKNGSIISSIPTTEDAGRSEAVSLLVIDEAAVVRWAERIWAASWPTLSSFNFNARTFLKNNGVKNSKIKIVKFSELYPVEKGPGVYDLSGKGYQTLTHRGQWKDIHYVQYKGDMEAWQIEDCRGKQISVTPKHRFYTVKGWKPLDEILEKNLTVIQVDTGIDDIEEPPTTLKPERKLKPIEGFPEYWVSNWGEVYRENKQGEKIPVPNRPNKDGYLRVFLKIRGITRGGSDKNNAHKSKIFPRPIASLVQTHFNGPIVEGYQIDHINCVRTDNYSTNLRLLTPSENVQRSFTYSIGAKLSIITGDRLPNLRRRGKILDMYQRAYSYEAIAIMFKTSVNHIKDIIHSGKSKVYITKLKYLSKSISPIYDIAVEGDHSVITPDNYVNHNTGGRAIINSCLSGDSEIISKTGVFRLDTICPKKPGVKDISKLGIEVLTHKGRWRKVLRSVNKGELETWEILTSTGDTLKCTPHHRLYTPNGWRTVDTIIKKNLKVIRYGVPKVQTPPVTIPPSVEILKPINGFPNYMISNTGLVYIKKGEQLIRKDARINSWGYNSISLWRKGKSKKCMVSHLVAKAFIGDIPNGYVVDHINCNPLLDYVTNLQIITISENAKRASLYSHGYQFSKVDKGFINIKLVGKILNKGAKGLRVKDIAEICTQEMGIKVVPPYVSRILNRKRGEKITLASLTLVRKYITTIYDIEVEEDHSYLTNINFFNHNTAFGIGNFFHKLFTSAVAGGNRFNPIRLHWQMHPERDMQWYLDQKAILGPRKTAQEIDGDFLTSGNTVFDLLDIKEIEDLVEEGGTLTDAKNRTISYKILRLELNGQLKVFEEPQEGVKYFIGADISTGRAQDYSAICIMDRYGDEKLCFKGKLPIDQCADLLIKLGKKYNNALIAPESNDIGLGVAMQIQASGYTNLYYSKTLLKEKGDTKVKTETIPGWYTTKRNRPVIIAGLEEDVRNRTAYIKCPYFCTEAYTFIYDETNRPVALNKHKNNRGDDTEVQDDEVYSDDSIFAHAVCNHIRKERNTQLTILPI